MMLSNVILNVNIKEIVKSAVIEIKRYTIRFTDYI